jgi:mono/diheme cytochrome c family protein
MPSFAGRLSERQIRDVAAFVTAEAARRARKTP